MRISDWSSTFALPICARTGVRSQCRQRCAMVGVGGRPGTRWGYLACVAAGVAQSDRTPIGWTAIALVGHAGRVESQVGSLFAQCTLAEDDKAITQGTVPRVARDRKGGG